MKTSNGAASVRFYLHFQICVWYFIKVSLFVLYYAIVWYMRCAYIRIRAYTFGPYVLPLHTTHARMHGSAQTGATTLIQFTREGEEGE